MSGLIDRDCERCAFLHAGCGTDFAPHIHVGDSGHVEGCMSLAPMAGAEDGKEADDGE